MHIKEYKFFNIKMNIAFTIIGYIGSFMLSILLLPQIHTTYITKNVEGLSTYFLIFEVITTILWIIYGTGFLLENNLDGLPIVIANTCMLISVIVLLVMKRAFKKE